MDTNDSDYSYLDRVRMEEGSERCRAVFGEICQSSRLKAVSLLNDRRITFPSLFVLWPQVQANGLYRNLGFHNSTVFHFMSQLGTQRVSGGGANYFANQDKRAYPALKWILETGRTEDGMNNEYEAVMDATVSVLINVYGDKSILPAVADMFFNRAKKDHYIHDLVWAFFRTGDPDTLKIIAEHIRSSDGEEAKLACSLLNLGPIEEETATDYSGLYESFMNWFEENRPFLYFTGESFQFSSRPEFFRVDLVKKYLCSKTAPDGSQTDMPLSDWERQSLAAFLTLNEEDQRLLSDYSYKVYRRNLFKWKGWMQSPIGEQIKAMMAELGERQ